MLTQKRIFKKVINPVLQEGTKFKVSAEKVVDLKLVDFDKNYNYYQIEVEGDEDTNNIEVVNE